jgi:NAD(P)-dependent dehydrogenase (short-subunit alcohol dehydrogenase family)
MFELNDKKAVITGAGSGIGRAMATLFASQGAFVHVIDISEAASSEVVQEIRASGGHVQAHACNVAQYDEVMAAFSAIGPIDILINNAGIAHVGKADTTLEADFDRVMSVNVKGVYHCLHAGIPQLRANGGGVIVNMASVAAWFRLFHGQRCSNGDDAVGRQGLPAGRDPLQFDFPGPGPHPFRGRLPGQELSREGKRDVREAGEDPADRAHGQARGSGGAGPVPVQRPGILHHRQRLSDRRRFPHLEQLRQANRWISN